ncbi:GPW/gp25 family protein (plasmid) [Vibrio cyclitrophicus]|uniref:GPW/gp25 family protein n=1 Tax=Vibrio cyclitrophicus TaxID=47951 RepID=UPI000C83C92A|nr:GPW/gp25 family protein [Vibrio cyclitrophicus]
MSEQLTKVYKRGWSFPPLFTSDGVKMSEDIEDITQSLSILFQTLPGERIQHPEYGCDLHPFMFKNISDTLFSDIEEQIKMAVLKYESRAIVTQIYFKVDDAQRGKIRIQVNYQLNGSDIEHQWEGGLQLFDGASAL